MIVVPDAVADGAHRRHGLRFSQPIEEAFHRAKQNPLTADEASNWLKFIEREIASAAAS